MNILVVDDEPAVCTVIELLLTKEGHAVTVCCSGAAALDILARGPQDLALVDLSLPAVGGASVVAALRGHSPRIPIIVITGLLSVPSPSRQDHPGIGTHDSLYHLAKPFRPADLSRLVARVLPSDADAARRRA